MAEVVKAISSIAILISLEMLAEWKDFLQIWSPIYKFSFLESLETAGEL